MISSSTSAKESRGVSRKSRRGHPGSWARALGAAASIALFSGGSVWQHSAGGAVNQASGGSDIGVADPLHAGMHAIRNDGKPYRIPAPGIGTSTSGVMAEPKPIMRPSNDGTGNFRVSCHYSHMNYDDAIIYPGQPGAAHLHTYFGNLAVDAFSTGNSLLAAGNSTCDGGTANRSAYWIPSMIDGNGSPIIAYTNMIYYKSGYQGVAPGQIVTSLPVGLKMLAGDMKATAPQKDNINWSCVATQGTDAHQAFIPSCPAGSEIIGVVQFPQCWDGVNLDSADHRSHVAYGTWGKGCPASHPVALPSISYNIHYKVLAGGTEGWRLSSDMYAGGPGGYSMHADIITAWDPAVSKVWLANCVNQNADCNVGQMTDITRLIFGVK
jgi:Domain of unknown function (DUF1996)